VLEALSESRSQIIQLYHSSQTNDCSNSNSTLKTNLLSLPISSLPPAHDSDILLTLISNYLLYSLIAFSYTTFSSHAVLASTDQSETSSALSLFSTALSDTDTLLRWVSHFKQLPSKHVDSVLTRAYTALTKSSVLATYSPADAKPMFRIRAYALHLLLYTTPTVMKPTTFWDQTVKFAVIFVKDVASGSPSADAKHDATHTVLSTFSEIMDLVLARHTQEDESAQWLSGSGFVGFCDYWMDFARRVSQIGSRLC
jgi:separase